MILDMQRLLYNITIEGLTSVFMSFGFIGNALLCHLQENFYTRRLAMHSSICTAYKPFSSAQRIYHSHPHKHPGNPMSLIINDPAPHSRPGAWTGYPL